MMETITKKLGTKPNISNDELESLAGILGFQFVLRRDLFAQQRDDGRYVCIRRPLHHEHLVDHLNGEITLGMYLLNEDSMGRHLVYDADDIPGWRRLKALANVLSEMGSFAYLERSRRGGHLWIFFEDLVAGETIRNFGQGLMLYFGLGNLELFPKQSQLSSGPGSLIRMPFGIHRKSGCRYGYYDIEGNPLAPALREQIRLFDRPQTVNPAIIERFCAHAPKRRQLKDSTLKSTTAFNQNGNGTPLHEQLKGAISVREFVSHHVSLSPSGTGLCPFHQDHVDSFSVNDKQNYWHCFACETGGSVIDFWMNYRDCDFNTAVNELAEMLL
ncbi:MAG: hypothetical protein JSV68_18380 [Anaerolineaceae bacterium]|nr:MAG: hypothetical protein JSV68_18380 [Anaerolineaceae bacterium]